MAMTIDAARMSALTILLPDQIRLFAALVTPPASVFRGRNAPKPPAWGTQPVDAGFVFLLCSLNVLYMDHGKVCITAEAV